MAPGARETPGAIFCDLKFFLTPRKPAFNKAPRGPVMSASANRRDGAARMFQDQRAYERVAMRAQVTCIVDSETSRGVSWNLSQAGIQVEVSTLNPKGAIQLSFRLPVSGVAVDAVGSIVWQHNKRYGIRFTYVGAQSRRSILQYVKEHTKH